MYTLVENEFRDAMRTLCRRYRLHYCDLLGHPIDAVARVSGQPATMTPGAQPVLDSSYFKRIEAIEFAVRFDDGVGPGGLKDADIVLVGVSRSSKTPLSIYLGYLGYKTANVPIVPGVDPPRELEEIDPRTIVGLTIDAESLAQIRGERARGLRGAKRRYADLTGGSAVRSSRSPTSRSRRPRGGSSGSWSSGASRGKGRHGHEPEAEDPLSLLALLDVSARARPLRLLRASDAGLDGNPAHLVAGGAAKPGERAA
jgi:hypothetical protein